MLRVYAVVVSIALCAAIAFIALRRPTALSITHEAAFGPSIEQQRACADAANRAYLSAGYSHLPADTTADYTSHFNVALNKCFVAITSSNFSKVAENGGPLEMASVYDAFERRDYGEFASWFIKGQQTPHVAQCEAIPPDGPKKTCTSKSEWQALMRPYMGTGLPE